MRYVLGFIMYGICDPWNRESSAPVLYVNGDLPSTGLPSELSGATVYPYLDKAPGVNWGADPRNPAGSDQGATITLLDDTIGTMGTLFFSDPDTNEFGLESNRLTAAQTSVTSVGAPLDSTIYFLENEAVMVRLAGSPSSFASTTALTLDRGVCGSTAQVHVLRPAEYSEDGSEDRLYLRDKPDWQANFRCGLYLFRLDQKGDIESYLLRRGIVDAEPSCDFPRWSIPIKFIEDAINSHTVGAASKEIDLSHAIRLTELAGGFPNRVQYWLTLPQAEAFFNEPLAPRGSTVFGLGSTYVSSLKTRLLADADCTYEVYCDDGAAQWVHKITSVTTGLFVSNGETQQVLKISAQLQHGGSRAGSTVIQGAASGQASRLRDWYANALPAGTFSAGYATGNTTTAPPKIRLRLKMRKSVVNAFLTLCCSRDGSSGATYDKLIGGVGVGLPPAYFNVGTPAGSPLSVVTNSPVLAELNQLLPPVNTYYFDLSQGISLKDFLTNEFIASQLLLGSLQDGLVTLRSWVHEVASTITLSPVNVPIKPTQRLTAIKRLDLEAGTNVLTLESLYRRSVRWQGAQRIKPEEVQPIRFWREGLHLTVQDISRGPLTGLVRAFYKVFGGAPRVFEVPISIEQYMDDGIEFADAVAWSDASIPTPAGLGINDDFFVIGTDVDYGSGLVNLKLLENTLLAEPAKIDNGGVVAPSLTIDVVTPVSATIVDVDVSYVGGAAIDLSLDLNALFPDIEGNNGVVRVDTYDHAPVGEKERRGTVEAYASIEITSASSMRLTFDSSYLRGSYTSAASLLTAGETKLNLSPRVSKESSLTGALIEPTTIAGPASNNFIQTQPTKQTLAGSRYTFR